MTEHFDRWVSIGSDCMSKCQINRYICRKFFSLQENSAAKGHEMAQGEFKEKLRNINGGSLLFDWTYIGDYNKLCNLVESGLNYDLIEENMYRSVVDENGPKSIVCKTSGIHWLHLFSYENNLTDWVEQLPSLKA